MPAAVRALDLDRFDAAPLQRQPFDHVIVHNFIAAAALPALSADFPSIERGGSYPTRSLRYGPSFAALVDELEGNELRVAVAAKFAIDLDARPVVVTVRGYSRAKDGRIHTDSRTKLVTALLYFNDGWSAEGGRLRLLRSGRDIDDYAAEVAPNAGTLLAFRCTENAWHGYRRFVGPRRAVQVNWVSTEAVKRREIARHSFSARVKSLIGVGV